MTDALSIAKKYFTVTPCEVPAEFAAMKTSKMKTNIEQYKVEGLGNMTFQHASAMFGMMKMEMMCVTPTDRDVPLFSYDLIDAMGKLTLIIELYDGVIDLGDRKQRSILIDHMQCTYNIFHSVS